MKYKNLDTTECHKKFGIFIKEARNRKNLTQQEVAEVAKISQVYLSHIERGARDVDLVLSLKLCDILNADIKDFVEKFM